MLSFQKKPRAKQGKGGAEDDSPDEKYTTESIYQYYSTKIFPAVMASLPTLFKRLAEDSKHLVARGSRKMIDFILPSWSIEHPDTLPSMKQLWSEAGTPADFMLRHFDTNHDGHISPAELLNMTEFMSSLQQAPESWSAWFSREWPLMDWKVGVFLWRSFGGILVLLTIFSIIPGRMHEISGRLLRWPILGMTYFLIVVELMVYVVIRLVIRIAEYLIARPKHRRLRRKMAHAKSYPEWYSYAAELDKSQKRDRWLRRDDDYASSKLYNWVFIRQLIAELKLAHAKGDSLMAMAVIQQCTRKNVGGIMSEELFQYSNSGEPKRLVKEFVEEVVTSLRWVTDEAAKIPLPDKSAGPAAGDEATTETKTTKSTKEGKDAKKSRSSRKGQKQDYDAILQQKVRVEKEQLWQSLLNVTLSLFADGNRDPTRKSKTNSPLPTESPESLSVYHRMEILALLKRARAAYGRTALCLSGGAMMGLYHFGHVLGLLEAGVLPHIISGTSGGSVVGAVICTRTDDEIRRDLHPEELIKHLTCFDRPWSERLKSVWRNGNLFDFDEWMDKIQWFCCGQTTFAEAYRKTGRVFCVTLSSTTKKAPPVLLNYLTAPNVTIASAVIASAAVPGFIPPVRLQYKDAKGVIRSQEGETYFDGSIEQDIPVNGLAEMLNCQFFIACQCNPHIVPFFFNPKGGVGRPSRWSSGTQETSWRGGFLLAALTIYLKNDMKAKFGFLHALEAAVGFTSTMLVQEFEGSTTVVPQVEFVDYFKLFSDPTLHDLYKYFQSGSVAAYEHIAMIKLHYSLVDVLDECINKLDVGKKRKGAQPTRRTTISVPESKHFASEILKQGSQSSSESAREIEGSSSSGTSFGFEDEDEYERSWVRLS